MNPKDEKKVQELEEQIRSIQQNSTRNEVIEAVNSKVDNDKLYLACKVFTNWVEKQKRIVNMAHAREVRAENKVSLIQ